MKSHGGKCGTEISDLLKLDYYSHWKIDMNRIFTKNIIIILLLVCLPFSVVAKSGDDHFYDMARIFPFDESERELSNKCIFDFYKRVNAYLDYATFPYENSYGKKVGHPPFLKKYERLKEMTFKNHRIWYHWGFNKDPRKFKPLVDIVNENIKEKKLKISDEYFFWEKLMSNIDERNKVLLSEWAKVSGYRGLRLLSTTQKKQSNGFVTLLVSIHLLGDHTTSETGIIIDRNTLYGEIFTAIDNLAGKKYAENITKAKLLKNKLTRVKGDPNKFLDVLAFNFTTFLYDLKGDEYNYKKKFKKLGYKLKKR